MYQSYPGESRLPDTQRPPAPPSVVAAARLMYAGAAASLVYGACYLISRSAIKTGIEQHSHHMTAAQVTSTQHALTFGGLAGGIIAAGLWLLVARACLRGQNWARILGTVLFAVFTVDVFVGTVVPVIPVLVKVLALLTWAIGVAVIVLLWRRRSSGYFAS